jgi:putative RecB family exonuclease
MSTVLLDQPSSVERQDGLWDYISPSRLNCWLGCGLKFKLRYLEGLRTPTTPALFLGKVVHGSLETLYRHRQLGVTLETDELARRIIESWGAMIDEEEMEFKDVAEEKNLLTQAIDLVTVYARQMPADERRPLAVEVTVESPLVDPVTGEDLDIPLLGIIDLVLGEAQAAAIVDFKTSARSSEPLEISHEIQLTSYAWAFRQLQGYPESGLEIRSLIKTKTPKVEIHRYLARTEGHFRRLFAVIREYLDALDHGRFNYRPGFGCGFCEFRDGPCKAWAG